MIEQSERRQVMVKISRYLIDQMLRQGYNSEDAPFRCIVGVPVDAVLVGVFLREMTICLVHEHPSFQECAYDADPHEQLVLFERADK